MSTVISESSPPAAGSTAPCDGRNVIAGREAERRAVRGLLDRAQRGDGGVVLVEGEPGIGKSLLLREAVDEAAGRGFSLAADTADQLSQAIPFFALRRALGESFARLIAQFPDHDRPAAPAWWISQIRAHLEQRAAAAPVLVCLDDLQWACAATLAALRTLPQELKRHPVAWILARSTTQQQEAERLFGLLEGDGAARVRLAPLTEEEVTALLTDAFGAPPHSALRTLAAGAAGNPRLLSELVGGLRDDDAVRVTDGRATLMSGRLPGRMHRAARQRLQGVSGQARHVLTTAAVLGGSFRLEDVAEMLDQTPAVLLPAVEETMAAGITTAGENEFSFRHQLLRRAVGDMIPQPGRKALHRQYGQILLNRGESAALAASHLLQAADPGNPASLADLDAAAEQTLRSAPQTAADLASRVLELTPPGDPDALPRAVAAAEALAAAGRLDQAERVVGDTLAKPLPPVAEARLRCAVSSVLYLRGASRDAAAQARTALALPDLPDGPRDDALTAYLQALASARDESVSTPAEAVLKEPGQYGSHVVVAALIALAVTRLDSGQAGEALELLRDSARHETAVSPDARHAQPLLALAAALVDLRQLEEAEAILDAADSSALHTIPAQSAASIVRARIHLASGRLADADAAARRALAAAESLGAHGYASAARCVLGVIALRRGDVMCAARHVASGIVPGPHVGEAYARAEIAMAQAQISEARDGLAQAVTQTRRACAELGTRPGRLLGDPGTAAWLTRAALAAGDTELAAAVARAAGALAAGNPAYPAVTAAAAHSLGLAGRDQARLAEAAATHPDPWARASAAEDLGLLHAGTVDHDPAVRHLTQAAQGYLEVGAAADVARTRRRLRKLGVRHRDWTRPALRPVTGWDSLTNAERTASELVAQGLNNRQVAGRMYVSEHTVAFYLRQAFRKLAIRSRVQLARIVIEQRPAPCTAGTAAS
jgi:DNA-binding CsgD family transcriptional regulator/tetratricopeptide (TPR) repeat protein